MPNPSELQRASESPPAAVKFYAARLRRLSDAWPATTPDDYDWKADLNAAADLLERQDAEADRLRGLNEGLTERVAAQSERLARRAERGGRDGAA